MIPRSNFTNTENRKPLSPTTTPLSKSNNNTNKNNPQIEKKATNTVLQFVTMTYEHKHCARVLSATWQSHSNNTKSQRYRKQTSYSERKQTHTFVNLFVAVMRVCVRMFLLFYTLRVTHGNSNAIVAIDVCRNALTTSVASTVDECRSFV